MNKVEGKNIRVAGQKGYSREREREREREYCRFLRIYNRTDYSIKIGSIYIQKPNNNISIIKYFP